MQRHINVPLQAEIGAARMSDSARPHRCDGELIVKAAPARCHRRRRTQPADAGRPLGGVLMVRFLSFLVVFGLGTGPVRAQPPARQQPDAGTWQATGRQGAVAAGGQGAVDAGLTTLKNGGNAADAAVATILALSVTDSRSFCFGGEVPIVIYDARRKTVEVLDGQGAAPR